MTDYLCVLRKIEKASKQLKAAPALSCLDAFFPIDVVDAEELAPVLLAIREETKMSMEETKKFFWLFSCLLTGMQVSSSTIR